MAIYNIISLLGIAVFLGIAWALSTDRRKLNWRVVWWGLGLQAVFACFVFVLPVGRTVFLWLNDRVGDLMGYANAGTAFVFGRLADGSQGFILAFQGLTTIIFFSALMSMLYYVGVMPLILKGFSRLFTRLMRISGAESLAASSNIFVGVESAFIIRPHLQDLTPSELCTVMTAGMATIASTVLAVYVGMLNDTFPQIAGHLVSASFLSAPAAIVMSKVIWPETDEPTTLGQTVDPHYDRENSIFEAVINGASGGMNALLGIVALLIAVLGLVALADGILGGIFHVSLEQLLGYVFTPLMAITGVPLEDCSEAGRIVGERLVATEVKSYQDLATAVKEGALQHPRSVMIIAYSLCGFAHLASVGIFAGGLSALAPERTKDISRVAWRALIAATLACLLTACVAGAFFHGDGGILMGGTAPPVPPAP